MPCCMRYINDLALPSSTVISNATIQLRSEEYTWDMDRLSAVVVSDSLSSRETFFSYNLQSMVTGATTCTNDAPAYFERFTYIPTGSMTTRTFTPHTDALAAPNASFAVNRADETTRHVRNGVATITGTADPAATVKYYPTAAQQPRLAEQSPAGNWVAPNIPMFPDGDGQVRIQFKVEKEGQNPSFQLSEFAVNKVTTPVGSDGNGSITNMPDGNILSYDCENNLHSISNTVNGAVILCWYDSAGRRIAKSESGLLTMYIWDGMNIIATANADGSLREYFTRGIGIVGDVGSLIAETRFTGGTTSTAYLHSNWRGDVVMAAIPTGTVVGEYAYTIFGEPLSATGSYTPRFGFSSKERDASGLVYYGFRYYSPSLCSWISEDPIGEEGGINLYQFCFNNPLNRVDMDGEVAPLLFIGGLIIGGVGYANAPGPGDLVYPGGVGEAKVFAGALTGAGMGLAWNGAKGLLKRNAVSRCAVQNFQPTRTVENHIPTRPYIKSPLTAQEIMAAKPPIPDPQGVPGALRWDVPGSYNGSSGTWELVVDPKHSQILHWLFKTN